MMTTFHGVKPNQQNCILKKKILEGLVTHGEIYGKSDHLVPFKTEELHILDMFSSVLQLIITWVPTHKKAQRGSLTSTLHDRHC